MTTIADVCNRAVAQLAEIPSTTPVIGITPPVGDSIAAANAASILYEPTYLALLRHNDWEFTRKTAPLTLLLTALAPAPPHYLMPFPPWRYEYAYPADCIRLRQLRDTPPQYMGGEQLEPLPTRFQLMDEDRAGVVTAPTKVILADLENPLAIYTANIADPSLWDCGFAEAMVRALASVLALTLAGRPDFAREKLGEAASFTSIAASRLG
jgi:hypothetical protein